MISTSAIISILFGGLLLWLIAKIMKQDKGWKTPYSITLIVGTVGFVLGFIFGFSTNQILVIGSMVLGIPLIKKGYEQSWGKTLLMWVIYFVLLIVILMAVNIILLIVASNLGLVRFGS